jgi:hypothetical protein
MPPFRYDSAGPIAETIRRAGDHFGRSERAGCPGASQSRSRRDGYRPLGWLHVIEYLRRETMGDRASAMALARGVSTRTVERSIALGRAMVALGVARDREAG